EKGGNKGLGGDRTGEPDYPVYYGYVEKVSVVLS
uniref:DUF3421 domain-containing protein n=1 Tax=Steinernema glaseri TaxID=37863 RepID=A0A1I7ZPU7_9BILA